MPTEIAEIDERVRNWLSGQHLFFVATAPSGPDGRVNVSPKGYDSFRVLGPRHVAYLDLTGSGAETVAHLRDNGRITIMFCAFEGAPRVVRMHGQGSAHFAGDEGYERLSGEFPDLPGARAIIEVQVERLSSSCGYSVPFMDYAGERPKLVEWADKKGAQGLTEYRGDKNRWSIDGMPSFDGAPEFEGSPEVEGSDAAEPSEATS